MATSVYTEEEVKLQDDSTVRLKPLRIAGLKKFMARWKGMEKAGSDADELDYLEIIFNCTAIALMKDRPEFWNAEEKDANGNDGTYTEAFEEAMDLPTAYKVMDICGGIKLNDPKLMEAAAMVQAEMAGTN